MRFGAADSVTIDGAPANIVYNDPTLIVVVTPAGSPGVVPVVVTTAGGASNDLPYTYVLPPTIDDVLPDNGSTNGGNSVTITGSSFIYVDSVYFDGTPASFTVDSDTSITAVVPAGAEGVVDVVVVNPAGSATLGRHEPALLRGLASTRRSGCLGPVGERSNS